jgi:hypothetical protein
MASKNYSDYLGSVEWGQRRENTMRRANWCCEFKIDNCIRCNEPAVDVHHGTYERIFAEREGDLMAVCREHHALIHGKLTDEQRRRLTRIEDRAFARTFR